VNCAIDSPFFVRAGFRSREKCAASLLVLGSAKISADWMSGGRRLQKALMQHDSPFGMKKASFIQVFHQSMAWKQRGSLFAFSTSLAVASAGLMVSLLVCKKLHNEKKAEKSVMQSTSLYYKFFFLFIKSSLGEIHVAPREGNSSADRTKNAAVGKMMIKTFRS
jgi:hypothetical protein